MTLTLGQLRRLLDERECGYSDSATVQAHSPYVPGTFEVSYLTGSITERPSINDVITLHLIEVDA